MNTRRRTRETQIQLRRIAKEKKERNSQKRERNQKGFFQTRTSQKSRESEKKLEFCVERVSSSRFETRDKKKGEKKFRVSVKMWGALSGASACRTEIENVTRRFKKTAFRVCESASVEREMRQYCRER